MRYIKRMNAVTLGDYTLRAGDVLESHISGDSWRIVGMVMRGSDSRPGAVSVVFPAGEVPAYQIESRLKSGNLKLVKIGT